ncbi:superoxide dismutase, Fe-Mn family, partial [Phenoliferia sp. Uapishka_3]
MLRSSISSITRSSLRTFSTSSAKMFVALPSSPLLNSAASWCCLWTATLPPLPYGYADLEPAISEAIMTLHHTKHHATYVANLNKAEADYGAAIQSQDTKKQIALQSAIKFNGGGHINHSLFWENLAPHKAGGGAIPTSGPLFEAVKESFGSFDELRSASDATALGIQGSGWAWIVYNPQSKRVEVVATANQDPVLGLTVLVGIDLWEHAFYLDYKNVKPDYLKAIWSVINWKKAEERLVAGGAKL